MSESDEAVEEIAQLIERVDADEYWDADPSIYEKYANAILAAGYRKVASTRSMTVRLAHMEGTVPFAYIPPPEQP